MSGWIKLHRSAVEHPCLQRFDEIGLWSRFLMLAAHKPTSVRFRSKVVRLERGQLAVSLREEARKGGINHARIRAIVSLFSEQGMIKISTDPSTKFSLVTVCNYEVFQSADAQSAHGNGTVSAQSAHTEREREESKKEEGVIPPAESRPPLAEAVAIWNRVCGDLLPRVTKLTEPRKVALRRRLAEDCGNSLSEWETYCRRIRASAFLTGTNDRGWQADFDFAVKQAAYVRVTEGKYDDRNRTSGAVIMNGRRGEPPRRPPGGGQPLPPDRKREITAKLREEGLNPFTNEGMARANQLTEEMSREQRHAVAA